MIVAFETIDVQIKRLREEKGLTKYRLAKLSGIAEAYIGQLEKGIVAHPRRRTLELLAKGLGVSPSVFFQDIEYPDEDIKAFLIHDLPELDEEEKDWLRRTIQMVRERKNERQEYKVDGR